MEKLLFRLKKTKPVIQNIPDEGELENTVLMFNKNIFEIWLLLLGIIATRYLVFKEKIDKIHNKFKKYLET